MPRSRQALVAAAVLLLLGACTSTTNGHGTSKAAPSLVGSYHLVGDVNGTQVKTGATVTLTLKAGGSLTVLAVQPGQRLTDTGSWSVNGDQITVSFKDEQVTGHGSYTYDGTTLRLPILVFGQGQGASNWTPIGPAAPASSAPGTSGQAPAADWAAWDLRTDGAAIGTKAYSDAVAQGTADADAVKKAAVAVQAVPGVSAAVISSNGRNIRVEYADGSVEYVVTERLLTSPGSHFLQPPAARAAGTCETLPGQSPDPREPGREGVNPGGGYGVSLYSAASQPKPVRSSDSPPAAARHALLLSPQYDIVHPIDHAPSTVRAVAGDNIECIQAKLTAAGYSVDTVLGHLDSGKAADTGDTAITKLTQLLSTNRYGVFYFLGHGYSEDSAPGGGNFAAMWMGAANLDRPEIKAVLKGKKIDHQNVIDVTKAYATALGLTWDDRNPPLRLAPDDNGVPSIAVLSGYFEQLRAKGANFDASLFVVNGCSSGLTDKFSTATHAKAFLGWKNTMDGTFISHAAEAIFDVVADKARTIRGAAQLWQLHQIWKAAGTAPGANEDPKSLVARGTNATPYEPIDAQTHILIFRVRHGPSSASSDIVKSARFVQNCFSAVWESGKHAGLALPQCRPMEYGSAVPTRAEVDDALFETGASVAGEPAGRWTLAD